MQKHRRTLELKVVPIGNSRGVRLPKARPLVVVSQNEMNWHLDTVVVCPLTTKLHPRWRSRVQVICAGRAAEIAVDQIRTIGKERLGKRLDALDRLKAARVRRLITEMYGE